MFRREWRALQSLQAASTAMRSMLWLPCYASVMLGLAYAAENCITSPNPGGCFHAQGKFVDARRNCSPIVPVHTPLLPLTSVRLGFAVRHLTADAERGDVNGMMNLAFYLNQGNGGPVDHSGSVKWWTEAAGKGINEAQNNLAQAYRFGKGVRADQAAANRWLETAAQGGHVEAQANLGSAQLRGIDGFAEDKASAVTWLAKVPAPLPVAAHSKY